VDVKFDRKLGLVNALLVLGRVFDLADERRF